MDIKHLQLRKPLISPEVGLYMYGHHSTTKIHGKQRGLEFGGQFVPDKHGYYNISNGKSVITEDAKDCGDIRMVSVHAAIQVADDSTNCYSRLLASLEDRTLSVIFSVPRKLADKVSVHMMERENGGVDIRLDEGSVTYYTIEVKQPLRNETRSANDFLTQLECEVRN